MDSGRYFVLPPLKLCGFPSCPLLTPFVTADFLSRALGGGDLSCPVVSKGPEITASFNSVREARFPIRELFSREAQPDDLALLDSEGKLANYFLEKFKDALAELSISPCQLADSESPLGKSVSSYFLRECLSTEIAEETAKIIQPFCSNCRAYLPGRGRISRRFLAIFQIGARPLTVELEKPEELFSAAAISVNPESFLEISRDGLLSSGEFPGEKRIPAADFIGASAKNPLTEEFIPVLPGARLAIISPGTRKRDLEFLEKFQGEEWKLSKEKLDALQIKFPARGGIFTEACGAFFGFPVEEGRRAILAELSKRGALLEVPRASGNCLCGRALVPSERECELVSPGNPGIQKRKLAYAGRRELANFSFREICAGMLAPRILPLFAGLAEAKNPLAYSYLLGTEKNFNLAWKDSGYPREKLLSAGKTVSGRLGRATFVCRDFGEEREIFLTLLPISPLGSYPDILLLRTGIRRTGAPTSFATAVRSGLSEEMRLAILSGNPDPDERTLVRLKRTVSKFRAAALQISALPEGGGSGQEALSAAYSRRKAAFLSAAGRGKLPEAVSQAFLFLSDFREFLRMPGRKAEGLAAFRKFAEEILAPILPKTAEEILSSLENVIINYPSGPVAESPPAETPEKTLLAREISRKVASDCRKIADLAGKKPKGIKIYLAEGWKYRLFRHISEFGRVPEETDRFFAGLGIAFPPGDLERFLDSLKKLRIHRDFLSLDEEARALSKAIPLVKGETGAETVQVLVGREIPFEKRLRALPGRPAILADF